MLSSERIGVCGCTCVRVCGHANRGASARVGVAVSGCGLTLEVFGARCRKAGHLCEHFQLLQGSFNARREAQRGHLCTPAMRRDVGYGCSWDECR